MKNESEALDTTQVQNSEQHGAADVSAEVSSKVSVRRRRLLNAGAAAGTIGLAVYGKSALATSTQVCQFPSTWASIKPGFGGDIAGMSHHPGGDEGCGFGFSPGFWRQPQKRQFWPVEVDPDSVLCSEMPFGLSVTYQGNGTKVNDIFPGGTAPGVSFSQLLQTDAGTDAWHYCAAYLNAFKALGYPLKPFEVVNMWSGSYTVGGVTWTRAMGRTFIENSIHPNSSVPTLKPGTRTVPACV